MKLSYSDYKRIQEMKENGFNANTTWKKLGFTEYSVYKVWNMSEDEFLRCSNLSHDKLDKYREFIIEKLKQYPTMTSSQILDRLKEELNEEIDTSIASYYRYMKRLRQQEGFILTRQLRQYRIASQSPPGELAQVDLGQMKMKDLNGSSTKVYFFVMVLSYSRMKFVYFSIVPFDSLRFTYAHDRAFRYLGGMPRQIMYDQDRVQVISENAGDVVFTKEYENYRVKAGFDIYLCKKQDPDTKGKVENAVKYVKTNFLANREFTGIDSLNQACLKWLDRTGNGSPNATTYRPSRQMFEDEASYLLNYEPQQIDLVKKRVVTASNVNSIMYKKNRYSIPIGMYKAGDRLLIEENDDTLTVFDINTGEIIATHKVIYDFGRAATIDEAPKQPKIYIDTLKEFDNIKYAKRFLESVADSKPRYVREQMQLLKKTLAEYGKEQVLKAMKLCDKASLYSVTDMIVVLVKEQGIEKAKKVIPNNTQRHYKKQAEGLAKYDILLGGGDGQR